jgi:chromosome partitioning protein
MAESKQTGMSRIIAIANQKGGAGKTTVAVNLAVAIGETGQRTLLVDVDPQADATTMLGIDPAQHEHTIYDVFTGGCEVPGATARQAAPGVDLLIGTERMSDVEVTLAEQIADYDVVLIDCPPNLGLLTINALVAAHEVLVVLSMIDRNAYKGAMALLQTTSELRRKGVDTALVGILRNNVDRSRQTYRALNDALAAHAAPARRGPDARRVSERAHRRPAAAGAQPRPHRRPGAARRRRRAL